MNPAVPADYAEIGRWLENAVASHAKREDPRIEVEILAGEDRVGRSYGVRLALAGVSHPGPGEPPMELSYAEVVQGRTRFAWCEALSRRVREAGRQLAAPAGAAGRRPG
jgi:hypothetical protein